MISVRSPVVIAALFFFFVLTALMLLRPGGHLITASCTYQVAELRFEEHEIMGRPLHSVLPPEVRPRFDAANTGNNSFETKISAANVARLRPARRQHAGRRRPLFPGGTCRSQSVSESRSPRTRSSSACRLP